MQSKTISAIGKDPRVVAFGKCLQDSDVSLVQAGKILLSLRQDIPDCDAALLQLFPHHLTVHILDRLAQCGSNKLIPAFVHLFGTVANKLKDLPLRLQKEVFGYGVDVVVGGTASKPVIQHYEYAKISPQHAAQVFNGKKIRSEAEQVAYRTAQAKAIVAPYISTPECFVANRKCRVAWSILKDLVENHFAGSHAPA